MTLTVLSNYFLFEGGGGVLYVIFKYVVLMKIIGCKPHNLLPLQRYVSYELICVTTTLVSDVFSRILETYFSEILSMSDRIDVDKPLWDQSTFLGRFKHFAWMTNPLSSLSSTTQLSNAKTLVDQYRVGTEPPGTSKEQV